MLGTLLDRRYRVTAILGAGGFGQTYIAVDTRRPGNPQCVVKHLKPASADPQFLTVARRLFRTEAEMLEKLGRHDQIPQLLAYFEDQQEFYLVQEFIEGQSLSAELPMGQPLPEQQVMGIVQEILNVLNFVHYHQVIHRDIKPDNLIRRQVDRHLVLIDFGAVKEIRTQIADGGQSAGYTVGIGTQGYMPGEQLSGRPRLNSDIYAVGMIGIKALTGVEPIQLPFDDQTAEIQWRSLAPQVSPGFAHVLELMVRSQFNTRYQSVTEVLQHLQALTPEPGPQSVPSTEQVSPSSPPVAPDIPVTDIVSPKPSPTSRARASLGWMAVGLVGVCGVGGTLAYALGLMPNFPEFQSQTSDSTPILPSTSQHPKSDSSPQISASPSPDLILIPDNCEVTVNDPDPPLNVRASPEIIPSNIVTTLDNGIALSVLGQQGDWLKIDSPVAGWISENLTQQVCSLPKKRVSFAPGATGSLIENTLNAYEHQPYVLNAQAQQTMTVRLKSGSVDIQVQDPQGGALTQVNTQNPVGQATLPLKGDYKITVANRQKSSERFSLDVDVISPDSIVPPVSTSRIQFPPGATGTQLNKTIQAGQRQRLLLNAGAQQQLQIDLLQGDIQVLIQDPNGQSLAQLSPRKANWQGQLPSTGDYLLDISATKASQYVINVDIK